MSREPARAVVRPVQDSDRRPWEALWQGYNAFYGRAGDTALPAPITQATWARFFDATEPVHALVAERDGELVGLAHYLYHRSTSELGKVCYLQDLFTAEGSRGGGVGRALIEGVCAEAGRAGTGRVYWHTHETNATARRLYDDVAAHAGFIVYRRML